MTWVKSNRLLSALLLVAIGFFVYYLITSLYWLPYENSMDYGEGFVMNYANMWAKGIWKWDITTPPYLTMAYGLGFPIMAYPFVKLFGAELWVGRAMSLLTTAIVCFIIYLLVKHITGKRIYGIIAALLPATQPAFRDWSSMARVDMPAVMLDMFGFYIAVRFKDSKKFYWCVLPFALAVMVKQIAVAAIIAVSIYLLINNRKRFFAFVGLFVASVGLLMVVPMIISGGTYWKHITLYLNGIENINLSLFSALFPAFLYPFIPLLFFSLIYLRRHWRKKEYTLPSVFFITAFIVDAIASSRTGSSCVYYYEAIFAGSICTGLGLPYLVLYTKRKRLKVDAVALLSGAVGLALIIMPLFYVVFPNQQYTDAMDDVRYIMSDSPKPIITENPAVALDLEKDLYIEYFIFTNMTRLGYWDETNYVNNYRNQDFDYILMRVSLDVRLENKKRGQLDGHFSDAVLEQIEKNYTLVYESEADCWLYDIFLYEANGKLANDDREIILTNQWFLNTEPTLHWASRSQEIERRKY